MKFEKGDTSSVDENTEITALFTEEDANFDTVISEVDGYHPAGGDKIVNSESERAYYLINGEGLIHVDEETYQVGPSDLVYIQKGEAHALEGDMKTLVITSPPLNPENERIV